MTMTTNEAILTIKANVESDGGSIEDLVTEWCNASEVEVSDNGDIWIAKPQTGHWLNDERKAEFVAWCEAQ
jgi:hypothetical protein